MKLHSKLFALGILVSTTAFVPITVLAGSSESDTYRQAVETRTAEDPKLVWTASHVALQITNIAPGVYAYAPDTAKEKPMEGEIVATGPGGRGEDGKLVPMDVKAGDRVLFGKWSGTEVKIDGEELLIMKESDIMGVIEGTAKKSKGKKAA